MKASELRIGNLFIGFDGKIFSWGCDDFSALWRNQGLEVDEMIKEPIPLTEEWLLKFGFEKYSSCQFDRSDFWSFEMVLNNKKDGLFYCSHLELYFSYVHQLQNLYFALTGNELEIK